LVEERETKQKDPMLTGSVSETCNSPKKCNGAARSVKVKSSGKNFFSTTDGKAGRGAGDI
jgi:hypothetical protein